MERRIDRAAAFFCRPSFLVYHSNKKAGDEPAFRIRGIKPYTDYAGLRLCRTETMPD